MSDRAIIDAVRRGDAQEVARMLGRDPQLARATGEYAKTGLHWAAEKDEVEIARLLLDAGACVDANGFFGATGLHWAAINGHRTTVNLLLERGASRTIRDARFKATPGGWAEEGGHLEIAKALRH